MQSFGRRRRSRRRSRSRRRRSRRRFGAFERIKKLFSCTEGATKIERPGGRYCNKLLCQNGRWMSLGKICS